MAQGPNGLGYGGPYISPPLICSRLSGTNQGARGVVVAQETQRVCFGRLQRSINAFLKRRVASNVLVQPPLLPIGSQTEARVSISLGISKVSPFASLLLINTYCCSLTDAHFPWFL